MKSGTKQLADLRAAAIGWVEAADKYQAAHRDHSVICDCAWNPILRCETYAREVTPLILDANDREDWMKKTARALHAVST